MSIKDDVENSTVSEVPVHRRGETVRSKSKPRIIKEVDISTLKSHPRNEGIYGHGNVSDLVALIKERGHIVNSLVINQNNIIISGHRRWMAAKELGYLTVPCEVIEFDSEDDELEALIHYNASREKTIEARVRESMTLEGIYSTKANERRLGNLKQNRTDMDELTISEDWAKNEGIRGATRDKVAKEAGLSSGKTYERGKKIILEADRLREECREDDAELLIYLLNNKSVSATADLANEAILDSLSKEQKQELKNGKISIRSIIPKSKDNGSEKKTKTQYASTKNHIKIMASSAEELENIGIAGNTDRQTQKIREDIEAIIRNLQGLLSE